MYRSLVEMVAEVGAFVGNEGSTKQPLIKQILNRWYLHYVAKYRWPTLLFGEEDVVTASTGQSRLYMPYWVERLYFIKPGKLDHVPPKLTIEGFYKRYGRMNGATGVITDYADAGELPLKADFSTTAEKVTLTAGSGDTGKVTVRGVVGDAEREDVITLNGTTGVDSAETFQKIFDISSDGTHEGTITVTGKTSGTVYSLIGRGQRVPRYRCFVLNYVPSSDEPITYFGKRRVVELKNDSDVPQIPVSNVIVEDTIGDMIAHQRKSGPQVDNHKRNSMRFLEEITKDIEGEAELDQSIPEVVLARSTGRRSYRSTGAVVNNG